MTRVLFFITVFITASLTSSAQTSKEEITIIKSDKVVSQKDPKFGCGQITYYHASGLITLSDSVGLKTKKFGFVDADKVEYDEKTRKMKIYNCHQFTMKGEVIIQASAPLKGVIEYTLDDDKVYLL